MTSKKNIKIQNSNKKSIKKELLKKISKVQIIVIKLSPNRKKLRKL